MCIIIIYTEAGESQLRLILEKNISNFPLTIKEAKSPTL